MSNAKKAEILGMAFGTANHRLRKKILFDLVIRFDLSRCYRCDERIACVDDFSVEHKKPWGLAEDPVEAFFDLDNIAFSHITCNVGAANREKTHCLNGHEYTDDNVWVQADGGRICKACGKDRVKRFHIAHPGWRKRSNRHARKQRREHGEMTER